MDVDIKKGIYQLQNRVYLARQTFVLYDVSIRRLDKHGTNWDL